MTDTAINDLIEDIVAANKILATQGVADAYGHVSARHPSNPDRYFMSWAISPALVTTEDIVEFSLDGVSVTGDKRKPYLEHFIHGALYQARPDVRAVTHSHSRSIIPFGVTGQAIRPVFHSCAAIGQHVPIWDSQDGFGDTNLLVSNMAMGQDMAKALGDNNCVLMRGHGSTVVGQSLHEAIYIAVFLEENAAIQLRSAPMGPIKYLSDGEINLITQRLKHAKPSEGYDRAWVYWCRQAGVTPRKVS